MENYDVVILGAGPGGTPAALFLAQKGKKVLLMAERGKPGGECHREKHSSKVTGRSRENVQCYLCHQ